MSKRAKALLNKKYVNEWTIYRGVPAKPICEIPRTAKFFSRSAGFVYLQKPYYELLMKTQSSLYLKNNYRILKIFLKISYNILYLCVGS